MNDPAPRRTASPGDTPAPANLEINNFQELLRALGAEDGDGLREILEGDYDPDVWLEDLDSDDMITIGVGTYGTSHEYPFTLGEVWEFLDQNAHESEVDSQWQWICEAISCTEGFEIDVDYQNREERRHDQMPSDYAHKSPADGSLTVCEWIQQRFAPTYPDRAATVRWPNGAAAASTILLSDLRTAWASPRPVRN